MNDTRSIGNLLAGPSSVQEPPGVELQSSIFRQKRPAALSADSLTEKSIIRRIKGRILHSILRDVEGQIKLQLRLNSL